MSAKKVFHIHTHNYLSVAVAPARADRRGFWRSLGQVFYNLSFYVGYGILKALGFVLNAFFNIFFYVGLLVAKIGDFILQGFTSHISLTAITLKLRFKLMVSPKFSRALGTFILICLIGWAALWSLKFVSEGLGSKETASLMAALGKYHLQQAQNSLKSNSLLAAETNFSEAEKSFAEAEGQINSVGGRLNEVLNVLPQKREAEKIARAGALVSQAGAQMVNFYRVLQEVKFTPEGFVSSQRPIAQVIQDMQSSLRQSRDQVSEASGLVQNLTLKGVSAQTSQDLQAFQKDVGLLDSLLNNLNDLFSVLSTVVKNDQNVLLFFANNNELRPVGGFLGSFGDIKLQNGQIARMKISSIYDLDGQLTEKILPPSPLLAVTQSWSLRDSNWFANFPDSAREMISFYEKEGGETPQLVVVLTPSFVADLLKVTGPIALPGYNVTLNSDNFIEQVQVLTSVNPQQPAKPKQILADFFPLLLQRMAELKGQQARNLLLTIQDDLAAKHIVLYSSSHEVEDILNKFNWAGQIADTDRDFLEVVSANLGGTKTDLSINQSITLTSTVSAQGDVTNELTITRTNTSPNMEGLENRSFLRIFVPKGSQLLENSGFDSAAPEVTPPDNLKKDSQAYAWEKTAVKDVLSGTIIGQEAGKTFFGNWLTLKGGDSKTVRLVYKLPFALSKTDKMSLVAQKQPGAKPGNFSYTLNFPQKVILWQNETAGQTAGNSYKINFNFNNDKFFGFILGNVK